MQEAVMSVKLFLTFLMILAARCSIEQIIN
ncbi:MAG: hypothetical protein H6Q69_2981 [Firmicutes bacterium]|nr:hypothetical protein [Bacillota bacterium]